MTIQFGREVCGTLAIAEQREWLVTNGIGGYACGTIASILTRHYHGVLIAALKPPLDRTLLLAKLDEAVDYAGQTYRLGCDRWRSGTVTGHGYRYLEQFHLEGTCPVWTYALADALLEKQLWMEPGANTTYVQYTLRRASAPLSLSLKALANYRNHHHSAQGGWQLQVSGLPDGVQVVAFEGATPFYWRCDRSQPSPSHTWYEGYDLAIERYRGIQPTDAHLHIGTGAIALQPGESLTCVVTTEANAGMNGAEALARRRAYEQSLIQHLPDSTPADIVQLHLAADQFIVDRTVEGAPGKTIIAGYPWFGDWGRDTMIALPGLTLATARPTIAHPILSTFARYLDQGMLPNLFPEAGATPEYNTVDAILWYFEAIHAYIAATGDEALLGELFPALEAVIDWHERGTRYQIHLDTDGLIYAGEPGVQLTWMDAKVGNWVVTPRIGKPVEISALWYNALTCMMGFAQRLGRPSDRYQQLAQQTQQGFQRFWNPEVGYCDDVLDGPNGNDSALRPNQIFAVALGKGDRPLLPPDQQKAIVDTVARQLLTSHGLRSLDPAHPDYIGVYGGDPLQRDGSYHQGTTWSWLIGPFVQAHLQVYQDAEAAHRFLMPLRHHLQGGCVGTLSEIFDGHPPHPPRGAFAQAWSVAEVLRLWQLIQAPKQ